jgi:type I restriction-modification system DNA methylase subunit
LHSNTSLTSSAKPRDAAGKNFLDIVFESGERYAREVETHLKDRAFRIVESIAKGFAGGRTDLKAEECRLVYQHSLFYLFRLLFVLNCESRGILNVNDSANYFPHSLRAIAYRLKDEFERNVSWSNRPKVYNDISELFSLIESGDHSIEVFSFGKDLFDSGKREFFESRKIPDSELNKAVLDLACAYGESGDLQFIDYGRLGVDHIGSVFEGLLEYSLNYAECDLVVDKKGRVYTAKEAQADSIQAQEHIRKGSLYLSSGANERKATGAFYTPDHIVDYIARETLGPLCDDKSAEEILQLRVCDPAMGSGHFLLGAVKYLERRVLEKLYETDEKAADIDAAEIRWRILHNCVFGIDINPIAVELAKVSLWIFTVRPGFTLEPLADQLFHGDALLDPSDKDLPANLCKHPRLDLSKVASTKRFAGRFDAVMGNPPYAPISDKAEVAFYSSKFQHQDYQLDLYLLFLERYEHYLTKNGRLGIIVSNTWLQSLKLRKIREYLSKTYRWQKVLHSEDKLFEATVDTHALIFTLGDKKSGDQVAVELLRNGNISKLHDFPLDRIASNGDAINLLANTGVTTIFESIRGCTVPLSQICDVFNGVKPFEKGKGKPAQTAEVMKTKPYVVEGKRPTGKDWMPLLRGSLIQRYKTLWNEDYWIKYGPWLAAPRDKSIFDAKEKLVIRQTGDSIIGTIAFSGTIARDNLHLVLPKPGSKIDLRVVLGILNSSLIDFAYYNINPEKGEALAQVKKNHVESLPMPDFLKLSEGKKQIAENISKLVSQILDQANKDNSRILGEIDVLVFDLFGISKRDRETITKLCCSFKKGRSDLAETA